MNQYLLIEGKNKKILTHKNNMKYAQEIKSLFKVNLYLVTGEGKVLDIKEVAKALCDQNYPSYKMTILTKKPLDAKRDRKTLIDNSKKIRAFITNKLSIKKVITIQELKEKFSDLNLSNACFSKHLKASIMELEARGFIITKKSRGCYVVV